MSGSSPGSKKSSGTIFNDQREPEGSPTRKWAIILPNNKIVARRIYKAPSILEGAFLLFVVWIDLFVTRFDKFIGNEFERTKFGPKGVGHAYMA